MATYEYYLMNRLGFHGNLAKIEPKADHSIEYTIQSA